MDFTYLMNVLVLAEFRIKHALLQCAQLEREPGSELLQAHLLHALKYVAVVAEEDVVALIVKRDAVAALVLRVVWEESGKRAANLQAQPGVEVIQNYLWLVFRKATSVLRNKKHW